MNLILRLLRSGEEQMSVENYSINNYKAAKQSVYMQNNIELKMINHMKIYSLGKNYINQLESRERQIEKSNLLFHKTYFKIL